MTDIINKYKISSLVPFSLTISEDKATGKMEKMDDINIEESYGEGEGLDKQ